jgi:phage tail-like protein
MSNALEKRVTPVLSHRFATVFVINSVPSPVDIFFQRISGLSHQMDSHRQGGQNVGTIHLPEHVRHGNLVFERGVMKETPLTLAFNHAMRNFGVFYIDVVIMLLSSSGLPQCNWIVSNAVPVSWQVGDLDSSGSKVLVNRLELACHNISHLGVQR